MTSGREARRGLRARMVVGLSTLMAIMMLIVCSGALVAPPALAAPATTGRMRAASAASRPSQKVAYARIAVVRVLTYYDAFQANDSAPTPLTGPCIADGVLVGTTGTTGNPLNSFNYVLTPTAAVNPITPCEGAQQAFKSIYGQASNWNIDHIDVLLNVAYTGTATTQIGTIRYTINPAQISTNGGPGGPDLLALALSAPSGAPTHDLPVLSLPQPSDQPASSDTTLIDLTNYDGLPLGQDTMTHDAVNSTLYPISLPASQFGAAAQAQPASTATPVSSQQTVTGGTAAPATPTQALPTIPASTPTSLGTLVGLGAAVINNNGRLVGMVISDAQGNRSITSQADITRAIAAITGKSGPLMTQWQQGIEAYYANPPQFSQAASSFGALTTTDPDFGGVEPFKIAASQQSTTIPSLTKATAPAPSGPANTGLFGGISTKYLIAFAAIAIALLLVLALVVTLLIRRRRTHLSLEPMVPPEEAMLDLLPPDASLDDLDLTAALEEEVTRPMAVVNLSNSNHSSGNSDRTRSLLEQQPTLTMPTLPLPIPSRPRQGLALMPHIAGLTDPGIKRGADPNQDNILALLGIRQAGGKLHPYGLFIVADGMGGHLNGQEASRLAIEIVTTALLQTLTTSQPLDDQGLHALLRNGIARASNDLYRRNMSEHLDMGTTITMALTMDDIAYIANVGDSRTYLMNPEVGIRQITKDHSVVASLVTAGVIRPDEIYTHPRRNQIYRSLGGEPDDLEVDTFEVVLQAGDKLLLCSDGLWEMVRDPQIEHILRGTAEPGPAVDLLVREANNNGGDDNISAIVVRMLEDVPENAQPGMRVVVTPSNAQTPPQPQQ